jgi:hypothetical protein
MHPSRRVGVVYVAFGKRALVEADQSIRTLRKNWSAKGKIHVLKQALGNSPIGLSTGQQAHWAKTCTDLWSPFDFTLLLDADTRIKGSLSVGFLALRQGWDLVVVPSEPRAEVLWHLSHEDKEATFLSTGLLRPLMLNTGVLFFAKTSRTKRFFECWRSEWLRFKGWDQGAFLRALRQAPTAIWLLGLPFNSVGGEVVDHLFGRARA